jgi:hypothetical protein
MKKINLDKRCQNMCAILTTIAIQLYRNVKCDLERGKENESNESKILSVLRYAYGGYE